MTTQPNDQKATPDAEGPLDSSSDLISSDGDKPNGTRSNGSSPDSSAPEPERLKSRADYRDATRDIAPDTAHTAPHTTPVAIVPSEQPIEDRSTQQNKGGRLRKLMRGTFWAAMFGATALGTAGLGAIAVLTFPLPRQVRGETVAPPLADLWRSGFRYQVSRPVNILIMGLDEARDVSGAKPTDLVGRTDTMLLVRVNPEEKSVNVMSIPRDTRVEIPGHGMDKINQANFEGGAELAAQTVMQNFDNVKIDRYVRVSTVAFKEIVDLVGGIEVMVPKPMQYEDKTQGLKIDLKPGLQTLNGDQAEQFARFRQDEYGDIGRVQRQQVLLKALRQRMTNPTVLTKLPQIVRVLQTYVDTNLTAEEMLALGGFGLNLDSREDLHMVMLPGRFSSPEEYTASYWISDQSAGSDLMRTYFDTKPTDLVTDASPGTNYYNPPSQSALSTLKIAVQNATDDQYASASMAKHLRDLGFDNVYIVRDWSDVERETSVVAQRGDIGSARSLKNAINLGQIEYDSTGDIDSDLTIRVGEDWLQQTDPTWQQLPYDKPR